MSVTEARKIMGKDADRFTDIEIEKIIEDLDFIAGMTIKQFLKEKQLNKDCTDSVKPEVN